jgi:TolA-binding protein
MEKSVIQYREMAQDAHRVIEQERENLTKRLEYLKGLIKMMDSMEDLLAENKKLHEEIRHLQQIHIDEKRKRSELEMRMEEMRKLSDGMAKNASESTLLKALRSYANKSKRKTADKRAFAKTAILEIAILNGLMLPEDLATTIEGLDDEHSEPKVVNVTGNYNDVHHNRGVNFNENHI